MRNYFLDNVKAILIIFVVLGHSINNLTPHDNLFWQWVYHTIYYIHMPLMFLISGVFSKNTKKPIMKIVKQLIIPYIIFNLSYQFFQNMLTAHNLFEFNLIKPSYGSWFLLTLFYFRIVIRYLARFPRLNIIIALLLHFFSGFFPNIPEILSLSRAFNFYIYFVIGFYLTSDQLTYYGTILNKKMIGLLFIVYLPVNFLLTKYTPLSSLLKLDQPFAVLDLPTHVILVDLVLTSFVTILLSLLLLNIITNNYNRYLSHIGKRTMVIYLGHLYVILLFRSYFDVSLAPVASLVILPLFIIVVISFILFIDKKLDLKQFI